MRTTTSRWRHWALAVSAGLLMTLPSAAQTVQAYLTSQAGDRLAPKPALRFGAAGGGSVFHIDEKMRDQEIVGFGASFLESGLMALNALDKPRQEAVLQALFALSQGLCLWKIRHPVR